MYNEIVKFSFIVPCYNSEKTIKKCLDSIANQTFKDFECIMFDDGSSDSTKDILLSYSKKDKRFKYFYHSNKGVSETTNDAIEKCSGDYVVDVDHDDWVDIRLLSVLSEALSINEFDIIGFFCSYYRPGDLKPNRNNQIHHIQDYKDLFKYGSTYEEIIDIAYNQSKLWETHSSTCIKKSIINQVKFIGHGVAADTIVMETLIHKSKSICLINKCLYNRLEMPTSISRSKRPEDNFLTQLERRLLFMQPFIDSGIRHPRELWRYMPMYLNERALILKHLQFRKFIRLWKIGIKMFKYKTIFCGYKHRFRQGLCLLLPFIPLKGYYRCD